MITPTIPSSKQNPFFLKIDKFNGGTATLINQARLNTKFAVESVNLIQDQDGIWRTRPGVDYYGEEISGATTIDGATEFIKTDGTREIVAVSNGKVYKCQDGGAWSEVSGATFTAGNKPSFLHLNNLLYISNRVDDLAVYNGTSLSKFSELSAPENLTATKGSGLSAGSITNYYRVVAVNEVGFTTPSTSVNTPTTKDRKFWDPTAASPEVMNLAWDAVSGATGYQVYHGDSDGFETYIGTSAVNSFQDRGEAETPKNVYVETPDDNTTKAPKFGSMEISGNIMWATYDVDNKWRVYWSGASNTNFAFSPYYGGGYVDIELGGKNMPYNVIHYRTGKGDPIATVLCSSSDGKGATYQIELTSVTVSDTSIIVPAVYKVVGSIGTDSAYGVVKVGDNVFYPNKTGIFALRNKPQMFNVLSTDNLIQPIRDQWDGVNQNKVSDIVGYYAHPRVYFSLAVGSSNDKTIVYDMERSNWSWSWNVGFNGFFEYTNNSGITKLLAIPTTGAKLVEISDNYRGDYGVPFYQSYISPLVPVNKDLTTLAKVRDVIYELGNFTGSLIIEVLGVTKTKQTSTLATKTVTSTVGTSGWGDDFFSDFLFSDTEDIPTTYTLATTKKKLRVNKKLYGIQFKIYTSSNAYFELLSIQAKGTVLTARTPSNWN